MNGQLNKTGEIHPEVIRREVGGWLAVSPKWARLRVGVTAETEDDARALFSQTVKRWLEIIEEGELGHSASN